MNDRIKQIRKQLGLTQEQFVQYLGIKRTALCNIERGERGVSEQLIQNILKTDWGGKIVNENWLRTGNGELFLLLPHEDEYTKAVLELSDDPLAVAIMLEYYKWDPHIKAQFKDSLLRITNIIKDMED